MLILMLMISSSRAVRFQTCMSLECSSILPNRVSKISTFTSLRVHYIIAPLICMVQSIRKRGLENDKWIKIASHLELYLI
jgi:hypothetical protein